jgi:hypothetical protein
MHFDYSLHDGETGTSSHATLILLVATLVSFNLAPAFASSINCTVTVPIEKPDLALSPSDLYFEPLHPLTGDVVTITASVHNIGEVSVVNIPVTFYVDDSPIATQTVSIPAGAITNVSALWTATDVGFDDITAKVDEENLMDELNEETNQAQKSIKVTKPLAISLTAYPEIITANEIGTSIITTLVTDELGRRVNGTLVNFSTTLGTLNPLHATSNVNGFAITTLTSSTSAGTATVTGSTTINGNRVEDTVKVVFEKTAVAKTNEIIEDAITSIEGTNISIPNTTVTVEDGVITINTTVENATIIAGNATAGSVISIPIEGGTLEITLEENATAVDNTVTGNVSSIKVNTPEESYVTSKPEVGTATTDLDVEFKGTFTPENLKLTLRKKRKKF